MNKPESDFPGVTLSLSVRKESFCLPETRPEKIVSQPGDKAGSGSGGANLAQLSHPLLWSRVTMQGVARARKSGSVVIATTLKQASWPGVYWWKDWSGKKAQKCRATEGKQWENSEQKALCCPGLRLSPNASVFRAANLKLQLSRMITPFTVPFTAVT